MRRNPQRRSSGNSRPKTASRSRRKAPKKTQRSESMGPILLKTLESYVADVGERRRESRQRDAVVRDMAADLAQLLDDGWVELVATRSGEYVDGQLLQRIRGQWKTGNCRFLAKLARGALNFKKQVHEAVGDYVARAVALTTGSRLLREFAKQLAARIPLFGDEQAVAVARGLQLTGIYMCLWSERNLEDCACFKDLVLNKTKEEVENLIREATVNWEGLGRPKNHI
jgi:hypothetical protein